MSMTVAEANKVLKKVLGPRMSALFYENEQDQDPQMMTSVFIDTGWEEEPFVQCINDTTNPDFPLDELIDEGHRVRIIPGGYLLVKFPIEDVA